MLWWKEGYKSAVMCDKCVQGELDHESAVTCVAATYDAKLVVSGKYGGGVCVWDVATQQPLLHLSGVLFLYMCFLEACVNENVLTMCKCACI